MTVTISAPEPHARTAGVRLPDVRRRPGEPVLDPHRRVEAVFDPAGILNPGKAL